MCWMRRVSGPMSTMWTESIWLAMRRSSCWERIRTSAGLKLFAPDWEGVDPGHAGTWQYNDGFMDGYAGPVKGDEGHLDHLAFHTRNHPEKVGVINYTANTNGFTMMDMVSL